MYVYVYEFKSEKKISCENCPFHDSWWGCQFIDETDGEYCPLIEINTVAKEEE